MTYAIPQSLWRYLNTIQAWDPSGNQRLEPQFQLLGRLQFDLSRHMPDVTNDDFRKHGLPQFVRHHNPERWQLGRFKEPILKTYATLLTDMNNFRNALRPLIAGKQREDRSYVYVSDETWDSFAAQTKTAQLAYNPHLKSMARLLYEYRHDAENCTKPTDEPLHKSTRPPFGIDQPELDRWDSFVDSQRLRLPFNLVRHIADKTVALPPQVGLPNAMWNYLSQLHRRDKREPCGEEFKLLKKMGWEMYYHLSDVTNEDYRKRGLDWFIRPGSAERRGGRWQLGTYKDAILDSYARLDATADSILPHIDALLSTKMRQGGTVTVVPGAAWKRFNDAYQDWLERYAQAVEGTCDLLYAYRNDPQNFTKPGDEKFLATRPPFAIDKADLAHWDRYVADHTSKCMPWGHLIEPESLRETAANLPPPKTKLAAPALATTSTPHPATPAEPAPVPAPKIAAPSIERASPKPVPTTPQSAPAPAPEPEAKAPPVKNWGLSISLPHGTGVRRNTPG